MASLTTLTDGVAVAGALSFEDFTELARRGFKSVINLRPDGESAEQLSSTAALVAAADAGLGYAYIPASKHELFTDDVVGATARALQVMRAPLVIHCASGQRAVIVWAAAAARQTPVADVLATLKAAGYNFDFLRDDLDAQADRARWNLPVDVTNVCVGHGSQMTPREAA